MKQPGRQPGTFPQTHDSRAARFRQARATLDAAQKPGAGVPAYTRWVNRRGARVVAAGGAALGWTPNHVTAASALLSTIGMCLLLLMEPAPWSGPLVALALAAGYLFDSADGQLARLTGASSSTGEWIDHVVDAFRSPAIHLTTAVALMIHRPESAWLAGVALVYALVTSGQFLSQILAEAFVRRAGRPQTRGGDLRSWVLLPTDPGTLCWTFALWGLAEAFSILYTALAVIAVLHCAASLRRRHRDLRAVDAAAARPDRGAAAPQAAGPHGGEHA